MSEQVTGETRMVGSSGESVSRPKFQLAPSGDYQLKIQTEKAEIRCADGDDSVPYVSFRVTGTFGDEAKKFSVFPMLRLKTKPEKDGNAAWKKGNQALGLARAAGVEFSVPVIDYTTRAGNTYEILDPHAVLQWLKGLDGQEVQGHIKNQKQPAGSTYPDKNEIAYFIESGNNNAF